MTAHEAIAGEPVDDALDGAGRFRLVFGTSGDVRELLALRPTTQEAPK